MAATCSSCGQAITWAKTAMGRPMPLDPDPTPTGNLVFVNGRVSAATAEDKRRGAPIYRSHFASCPNAKQHRHPRAGD